MRPTEATAPRSVGRTWAKRAGWLVFLLIAGAASVLVYLEEVVSYNGPGTEIGSLPLTPGQPFELFVEADWLNYARVTITVDVGSDADPETRVAGESGCLERGVLQPRAVENAPYLNPGGLPGDPDLPPGWIPVWETSHRSDGRPLQCRGTFTVTPPAPAARVVITKQQRPSGFFAF